MSSISDDVAEIAWRREHLDGIRERLEQLRALAPEDELQARGIESMIRFNEWLLPALEQRLEEALGRLASDMRKLFSMLSVHETRHPAFERELPVVASGTLVLAPADAPRLLRK